MVQLPIMKRRSLVVGLFLLLFTGLIASQETPRIVRMSAGVAETKLVKKIEPVWPQLERLNIQGTVVLYVRLSTEGKVEFIKVISGHPMLVQAAMDAVKQWEYRPTLLNGQPAKVETTVVVPFSLLTPEQRAKFEAAAAQYHQEEEKCGELVAEREYSAAETACAALPELSEKLDPALNEERVRAFRDVGVAFFAESKFQDALTAFQQELETAKAKLPPASVHTGRAYADVAHGLQSTSHHEEAATNYAQAVAILEHIQQGGPDSSEAVLLRTALRDYALLLRQLGKTTEAAAVEQKLKALSAQTDSKNQ